MNGKVRTNVISKLIEQVQASSKRMPEMEDAVRKAVDALDDNKPRFPLSPSAALKPLRDLYYSLINFYEPGSIPTDALEPTVKLTFKIGYMVESMLLEYFKEAYELKDEQRRVTFGKLSNGTELTGSIDWSIQLQGETILMDCKSINSYGFTLLTPRNQNPKPKEDNIAQMQLYMHSDWGRKNNVNRAVLVYFNKDISELKAIEIKYNKELAEAILARLYTAFDFYMRRELPPREYVLGVEWQALYTAFKTYDNAEFALPLELRPKIEGEIISDLKTFVLTYGNAVVTSKGESVYVRYTPNKLILQTVGEKIWYAV